MHIFTAVVGAGVLALPSALSWLGWVFGIPAIVLFFVVRGRAGARNRF